MPERKVLMMSPYWPPTNRIGLWRALRLARYLPDHNWTPVICTPRQEDIFHFSLNKSEFSHIPNVEVIRPKTFIPSIKMSQSLTTWKHLNLFKSIKNLDQNHQVDSSTSSYWSHSIQKLCAMGEKLGNRLIKDALLPDQFVEWGLYMAWWLKDRQDIDLVWATGGPFGNLVAGALVAQALNVPLVLDYRDPWTTHRIKRWSPLSAPQFALRMVEAWALSKAQGVSYVNEDTYFSNRAYFGQQKESIWRVIPNAFDPIDLGSLPPIHSKYINLLHAGNFYGDRSLLPCLSALRNVPLTSSLRIELFGSLDQASHAAIKKSPLPVDRLMHMPRCGAKEIGARMKGADALLLVIGGPHAKALSGKIFDYIAAGRPIIGVGPKVALARTIIEEYQLGVWVDHHDSQQMTHVFKHLSQGNLRYNPPKKLSQLHAKTTTQAHAHLFEHVMSHSYE